MERFMRTPCITKSEEQLLQKLSAILDIECQHPPVLDYKCIKIQELQLRSVGKQGTEDWLDDRHNFITASISAAASGNSGPVARETLLLDKATYGTYNPFYGGFHTDYGHLHEPIAKQIYSNRHGIEILDFGLIQHPTISYLGASTDGVSRELINFEIKSLSSRSIDNKIKKIYYHQMQHQMYCLGLETSMFIEGRYQYYSDEHVFYEEFPANVEKGIIIEVYRIAETRLEYLYSPETGFFDKECLAKWHSEQDKIIAQSDNILHVRDIYWSLLEFSCTKVPCDPEWGKIQHPLFAQFWEEVLSLRENPDEVQKIITDREKRVETKKTKRNKTFSNLLLP